MKFRLLMLALLTAAPLCAQDVAPPTVPDAAQITARWRSYFQTLQNLRSWSFAARMQLWEKDAKEGASPRLVSDIVSKFDRSDKMFRREMGVREADKAPYQVVIVAYDGKKHQMAVNNPQPTKIAGHAARALMILQARPFPDDPTVKAVFYTPLTMPFIFAADEANDVPFASLQKAEFWAKVQTRITKVVPDTWEGLSGTTVTLNRPAGQTGAGHLEVFVDDTSGLPLRLRNVDDATQNVIGEIKITQLRAGENGLPAFPLRVEISGTANPETTPDERKTTGTGLIEVNPASLSLNTPLAADRFTIPLQSMEFVIENDKIVYSRYPLKRPAKKPVKKATKKPVKKN